LALQDIPIIAFTAGVQPKQQQAAREAGCNDVLPKPVGLEGLVAVLLRWTADQRPNLHGAVTNESSVGFAPPRLDLQKAANALGGDIKLAKHLLQQFLLEFNGATQLISDDLAHGGWDSAARRLHSLKGGAGYFDAPELCQIARDLEEAILSQQADLGHLLSEFDAQLSRFIDSAKSIMA
jgi:HPt (histidine-containing phosphotransfer) domain-containing protein